MLTIVSCCSQLHWTRNLLKKLLELYLKIISDSSGEILKLFLITNPAVLIIQVTKLTWQEDSNFSRIKKCNNFSGMQKMAAKLENTEIICPRHDGSPVLFWCSACTRKLCVESHLKVKYRKYLHQWVSSEYSVWQSRIYGLITNANNLLQELEATIDSSTEKLDSSEEQKKRFLSEVRQIKALDRDWASVEIFVENMDHPVNLNSVEEFFKVEKNAKLTNLEVHLKGMTVCGICS